MFGSAIKKGFGDRYYGKKHFLFVISLLFNSILLFNTFNSRAVELVNNLSFDLYSQEHGLSNSQIHCVLQDRKGWIWIGTSQGVCRFDGYRFTVFKNDPDDSTSLKGNLIRVIFEDRKGQLWIGTENGGLNKFDRDKETFSHYFSQGDQPLLNNVSVTSIQEDQKGSLWIGTETNLFRIDGETSLTTISPSNLPGFSG
ncbi:MAG TPA: two-component regulator propeller domain-containing protein [Prolixibacteraceae bacterium]|nr:two-component regulator propeller domain-containing protein [Prolixibacteraceae bacterium]